MGTNRVSTAVATASMASLCACIIPDAGVGIQPARTNPGAVRVVQSIPLTDQVNEACGERTCPLPPATVPPGLIVIEDQEQAFCSCPDGTEDANALGAFDIFVEDPDQQGGVPTDRILGAFLLDAPAQPVFDPSSYLAFENYLRPTVPAQLVPGAAYNSAFGRPTPNLKAWTLGAETGVDLCNNDNGSRLAPGIHDLRLVVTDRDWYVPVEVDDEGRPIETSQGFERTDEPPQIGVPDLPAGATYDVVDFVFRCLNPADSELCRCESSP